MKKSVIIFFAAMVLISCNSGEPKPLVINADACEFCKMTISNGQFGAEVVTEKGRYYKFDDVVCMVNFTKENTSVAYKAFFVGDYSTANNLIPAEKSYFLKGGNISSPMRGNAVALASKKEAQQYKQKFGAEVLTWDELYSSY